MKKLVDVDGDGNCFYRALYGYALYNSIGIEGINSIFDLIECEKGKNKKVSDIINHPEENPPLRKRLEGYDQEEEWIKCFREYMKMYLIRNPRIVKDMFDRLVDPYLDDESYEAIVSSYPVWFYRIYGKTRPSSLNAFVRTLADYIGEYGKYASFLDISIVQNILNILDYEVNIRCCGTISKKADVKKILALFPDLPGPKTFNLVNISEGHYNFVWYDNDSSPTSPTSQTLPSSGGKSKQVKRTSRPARRKYTLGK